MTLVDLVDVVKSLRSSAQETNASLGICCVEMDIWEANKYATAYTPHPCSTVGPQRCVGDIECGYGENGERWMGLCDKDGCDLNTYRAPG